MSQWQLLRASRANQAALGYRVQHGAAAPVYYSTAVAAAGGNCGRSFCLSSEKQTLQQLNGRLASYLQQVQCLEAANQRLECQIQEELNRKCPGELRQLDGYLRRASLLQDKISECLSDQAQVKLQLLGAQLDAFDLNARCEKECERRGRVEAELSDLRELDAELKIYKMPELESLLDNQMQQLVELQTQHRQDVQVLVGQVSGGIAVEMQTAESSDLLRQLKHLRTTSVPLLDRNPKEYWFKTQVSTLSSPEVTFDPAVGSDLDQAEVKELRRTATTLTEELTRLQALILVLEVSGREQADSFVLQLEALQQKVDGLCRDLDSVLQAAAQQAADYDALLDIKSRLEAEIQDYKRLLDEINQEKVSSLHLNSKPVATTPCVTTSPSAFRRNVTVDNTVRVLTGNLRTPEVQIVSKGHVRTVEQTSLSGKVTTVQVMRDHSKHLKNSPVRSINTANMTHSFNQSVAALPESTGRESFTVRATVDKESNLVEDKVHAEDCDLQDQLIVQTEVSQGLDKEVAVVASQTKTVSTLIRDSSAAVQTKLETTSGATTTGASSEIEMNKTSSCAENKVKTEPHFKTSDPGKPTARVETETVILAQMDPTEDSVHAKNKTPAQIMTYQLETPSEIAQTSFEESQSHIHGSTTVQVEDVDKVNLMEGKDVGIQRNKEEEVVAAEDVLRLVQSSALSKKCEIEVEEVEVISDIIEVKVDPRVLGGELVGLAGKEASLSTGPVEVLSPKEADVLTSPTSPEICPSTIENSQIEITKTSIHAELEVKPEQHFETPKPCKPSATEDTETVILTVMDPTKDSVHVKDKTPAQVMTCELETPSEVAQTSVKQSGSHIYRSETVHVEVVDEVILMDDKDKEIQGEKKEEVVEAEGVPILDQSLALSKTFEIEVKEVEVISDTIEVDPTVPTELRNELVGLAGKEASMSTSSTDSGLALSSSGPEEILSPREANVLTSPSPEICLSPIENSQVEVTKTSSHVEPVVKQEQHFETPKPCKPSATEDTETVILTQMGPTKESVHVKDKTPAQVMTCELETPSEVTQTSVKQSGSHIHRSETVHVEVVDEVILMDDKDKEIQGEKKEEVVETEGVPILDQSLALSKKFETEVKEVEVISDTIEVDPTIPTELGNELINLAGKEALISISLADSGVALSSSGPEEVLSPGEADILTSPTSPDICLSQVETDVLMSMTDDQLFFPVDLEDDVGIPELLLPNGEEDDEDACLNLTEANVHVRPVEKYILSTKDEGQSLLFGGDEEGERNTKVIVSDRKGLFFTPLEDNKEREDTSSGTNIGSSTQVSRNPKDSKFGEPDIQSIIADKEEQLGFGGLYRKGVRDVESSVADEDKKESMESDEMAQGKSDRRVVSKPGNSESFESQKEGANLNSVARKSEAMLVSSSGNTQAVTAGGRFVRGGGERAVYGGSLGCTSTSTTGDEKKQLVSMVPETSQSDTGRFGSRGSREWMVYGGSLKRKSSLDDRAGERNEELPSVDSKLATSAPETGRLGKRGSGEWIVYRGSLGRKTGQDVASTLSSKGNEEKKETGRFGSRGSGEWMVYGSRKSNPAGSNSLPNTETKEYQPTTMNLSASPLETGKFNSRESGQWRVYGGQMSSRAGNNGLPSTEREGSPSVAMQRAFSPPAAMQRAFSPPVAMQRAFSPPVAMQRAFSPPAAMQRAFSPPAAMQRAFSPPAAMQRAFSPPAAMQRAFSPPGGGRFGSEGSGEWRVYGGSTGRVSTAGGGVISPPSSYTRSGSRHSSVGSSSKLSSSCVVKRSSSVGSGGRLSSSGSGGRLSTSPASHSISSSGRYTSTGSGEWKPVYSSASGRKSSMGSTGRPTSSQRAPSPGGRMGSSGGSGGWLNSSSASGNRISGTGSGSKLNNPGSNDKISSRGGGIINSSSGSGRTNSTGGRVISSSDRPIRSTGSGAGGHKERISVCKMAALSISAAGRERSKDKGKQDQRSQQQPQQAAASSPLVQRWLTSADP